MARQLADAKVALAVRVGYMDEVSRAIYESRFENQFLRLKGNAFQDLFADIMEKRYPGDFQRIRAGGREGDHKADGYLKSARMVYQVYAPDQMLASTTTKKIKNDFEGACKFWLDRMAGWTFVHNCRSGLLPAIVDLLDEIEAANQHLTFERWGFEELRSVVFELEEYDLASLFGQAPNSRDIVSVSAEDLKPVILGIAAGDSIADDDVQPIPPDKLSKNQLSLSIQLLLKHGMASANQVRKFFNRSADPGLGDKVAGRFKYQYGLLKGTGFTADEIFLRLRDFALEDASDPKQESAALALLAYLFEQCDIFERP
jgi:hypothetical protein